MAKKENLTRKAKSEISRIQQAPGTTRKTAIQKMRAAAKAKPMVKARKSVKRTKTLSPISTQERCWRESLRRYPAISACRTTDQGAIHSSVRRTRPKNDLENAGSGGHTSREVPDCASFRNAEVTSAGNNRN